MQSLIQQSAEKVDAGSRLVDEAGKTMTDIVAQVQRVNDLVGEISSASHEQPQGIEQVGDAVSQLDQVTQQNAALVEESAAAADSMKQQAHRLAETVAVFNVGHRAEAARAPTPVVTPKPAAPLRAAPKAAARPALATLAGDESWSSF